MRFYSIIFEKPSPFHGNQHYKKYIEDNNGECPLPLLNKSQVYDMKWWK